MSLIDQFTGDRKYTIALTAVCNLDWQQQSNQALVPEEHLRLGCRVVDGIIRQTQPKIVAALTVKVWELPSEHYRDATEGEIPCVGLTRSPLRLSLFKEFDTFLIKVAHPSRPVRGTEKSAYRQFAKEHLLGGMANRVPGTELLKPRQVNQPPLAL
jgi:hypothetical protein